MFVYQGFTSPISDIEYDAVIAALFGISQVSTIDKFYPPEDGKLLGFSVAINLSKLMMAIA